MTEVLAIQPEGKSYYQRAGINATPLKSSLSMPSLLLDKSPSLSSSPRQTYTPPPEHREYPSPSPLPSNTSSFSTISTAISDDSALFTDASTDSDATEDDFAFPNYEGNYAARQPTTDARERVCDESAESTTDTTISESPLPTPIVADDTAVRQEPSRQVDFLSHEWREEDIWSSWRHIVSQRKTVYGERSRLENASWRTWAKTKFDLHTVSPERLNWLKESDVTWLYGPLKVAASYPITDRNGPRPESQMSKNNSFVSKKPILKKRSMSEVMLQKSLSTSSLVKQAAASVQAQSRQYRRSGPEVVDSKLHSETPSRDQIDYFTSRSTSSHGTPLDYHEKRHIRFDDRVEQCIAVDCKDAGLDDEEDISEEEDGSGEHHGSDSSSDDGLVMMKRKKKSGTKKRPKISRNSSSNGRKIIETLPSTTLKYRTDSPDVTQEARHHTFGKSWNAGKLSPSPSQETLRPSNPSSNFLLHQDDDEDDDDIESDSSWSFGASNPKSSLGAYSNAPGRRGTMYSRTMGGPSGTQQGDFEVEGMRRTESGMFMPLDEDEDDVVAAGLFGRVSETINTARDIAHVIWNVGWRNN